MDVATGKELSDWKVADVEINAVLTGRDDDGDLVFRIDDLFIDAINSDGVKLTIQRE